jgi:hypothetical protein
MVVIGVIARTNNITYSLSLTSSSNTSFNFTDIPSNAPQIYSIAANTSRNATAT